VIVRLGRTEQRIMRHLEQAPATRSALAEALGLSYWAIANAIISARRKGWLTQTRRSPVGPGGGSFKAVCQLTEAGRARLHQGRQALREMAADLLDSLATRAMSCPELVEDTGRPHRAVDQSLRKMHRRGLVERVDSKPYRARWRLTDAGRAALQAVR
jgi:DNA-binding MarR family transcriptional regulator